jgi:hypothetical protein
MLSSSSTQETGVYPLAPLEELGHWFMVTTIDVVLGLSIGMIAARLMRSRHLHWSWAAATVALAAVLRPAFASSISTLGVAGLSATAWSRRWHREDLDAGSDLAEIAAGRRGPLDVLRSLLHGVVLRRLQMDGADGWFRGEELILGRGESGRAVSIPFGGAGGGTHTLVVGATGSGKTVTQTWMAVRAIEHDMGAIVIDPKGDRDMRGEVCRTAQKTG